MEISCHVAVNLHISFIVNITGRIIYIFHQQFIGDKNRPLHQLHMTVHLGSKHGTVFGNRNITAKF